MDTWSALPGGVAANRYLSWGLEGAVGVPQVEDGDRALHVEGTMRAKSRR